MSSFKRLSNSAMEYIKKNNERHNRIVRAYLESPTGTKGGTPVSEKDAIISFATRHTKSGVLELSKVVVYGFILYGIQYKIIFEAKEVEAKEAMTYLRDDINDVKAIGGSNSEKLDTLAANVEKGNRGVEEIERTIKKSS